MITKSKMFITARILLNVTDKLRPLSEIRKTMTKAKTAGTSR